MTTSLALLCVVIAALITAGFAHDLTLYARRSIGRLRLLHSCLAALLAIAAAVWACVEAWL